MEPLNINTISRDKLTDAEYSKLNSVFPYLSSYWQKNVTMYYTYKNNMKDKREWKIKQYSILKPLKNKFHEK